MIFVVWCDDPESSSGTAITGVFDTRESADNFAESEGPDYKVAEMTFGPIDWTKMNYHPIDWSL